MGSQEPEEDAGLESERLQQWLGEAPDHGLESLPTFKPWHQARKQYVRSRQVLCEIDRMYEAYPAGQTRFAYLSLPGDDLLDIRFLHKELCEPRGISMRFLGFNSAASPASPGQVLFNQRIHAIRRLPGVEPLSDVVPDDIRTIAATTSTSGNRLREFGVFNAINVDLCDGLAANVPDVGGEPASYFDMLNVLVEHQSRTRLDSLIFLTTRVGELEVHRRNLETLDLLVGRCLRTCPEFEEQALATWPGLDSGVQALSLEDRFLLGLAAWLVEVGLKYRMEVELRSKMTYRVNPASTVDDLLSVALRLHPHAATHSDDAGLTRGSFDPAQLLCELCARLPDRVAFRNCVDDRLDESPAVRESCVCATEELLRAAGYDVVAYRAWNDSRDSGRRAARAAS